MIKSILFGGLFATTVFAQTNLGPVVTTNKPVTSVVFLVPMENRDGDTKEFYKNFVEQGYDAVIASDYYGLRGKDDATVKGWMERLFKNAAKFEVATGIIPQFVLDIKGFRLNTNVELRKMARGSKYICGYHTVDEPDAHLTGEVEKVRMTSTQLDDLCKGTINQKYSKPLWITFENQAGKPHARKWAYRNNNDAFYLAYIAVLNKWHSGENVIGIDYYLFTRATNSNVPSTPTDQKSSFDMMRYFYLLVAKSGLKNKAFSWTETVYQGLNYICSRKPNISRPATPEELRAQMWLWWVAGQRQLRGDFNYIFDHLCEGKKGHNHQGLLHPYYTKHKAVVLEENEHQRKWARFLDQHNVPFVSSNQMAQLSLRFYLGDDNRIKILMMLVNISNQNIDQVGFMTHPILNQFGPFEVVGSTEKLTVAKNGTFVTSLKPYEVKHFLVQ